MSGKSRSIYMDKTTEEFLELIRKHLKEELMMNCNDSEIIAAALRCYWTMLK